MSNNTKINECLVWSTNAKQNIKIINGDETLKKRQILILGILWYVHYHHTNYLLRI